jgi:hypothetical protein
MASENQLLRKATEVHDEATLLKQASRELADMGQDHEVDALQLEETLAGLRGWREHVQERVREVGGRQRPTGESGHSGA